MWRASPEASRSSPGKSRAYVSHLTSSSLTRLDGLSSGASGAPTVSPVALPASPLRQPTFVPLNASLGWSLALDPSGARLFAPRHALGALGFGAWWGAASVDVLRTAADEPLSPARTKGLPASESNRYLSDPAFSNVPWNPPAAFVQPRDAAYRATTSTLLVADEGLSRLVELDATVLDPTLHVRRTIDLAGKPDELSGAPTRCGAPAGVALSADEATAWVFCRSTASLAVVHLGDGAPPPAFTDIAKDPLPERAAKGRRLFYDARDAVMSRGVACATCHPEGRDDGHVWHELEPDKFLFLDSGGGKIRSMSSPRSLGPRSRCSSRIDRRARPRPRHPPRSRRRPRGRPRARRRPRARLRPTNLPPRHYPRSPR